MNAELEAEFHALEVVLSHSEGGELCWPDAEDVDAFRDCAQAASRLGWLGNDGAAEPPPPVGELDSFLIGYGGWLTPDTADIAAHQLAVTIIDTEAEWREDNWEALSVILDDVVDGLLSWPVKAADRTRLFDALWHLGWLGVPMSRWHPRTEGRRCPICGGDLSGLRADAEALRRFLPASVELFLPAPPGRKPTGAMRRCGSTTEGVVAGQVKRGGSSVSRGERLDRVDRGIDAGRNEKRPAGV